MSAIPPDPAVPALLMEGVTVGAMRDPDILVAEDVNWSVAAGDYWVMAGLQGSGKSDFLMMTGSLMAPRSGRYSFFGQAMPIFEEARLPQRLRLGLVFDGGQLFSQLTVAENIALPLRYHQNLSSAQANDATRELMAVAGLEPWTERVAGTLPRSWQRRAGLVRALVLKPDVLLVDNPLGGLDLHQSRWWLAFLDQLSTGHPLLQGRPMTLIVTATDVRPWQGHARQLAVLRNQRLTVLGAWSELEGPDHPLLHELLTDRSESG
jgi:ABC-type transporter Mla maintaining outer membrane lipid asymmetry ATPase subunit MlaF